MWILPKQLHTSHFVLDMEALISDLDEQSQICEPLLLARSKPSLARTWSQRWKRDSWTQHLSGRILKPSHGQSFVTAWTSSLEVIPASHSQQQASDSDEMTHDTSGLGSQMELELCDLESASLRTSKDTSASDSERSSASWKALVIRRRGEYSLRVKSAHLTNASASSSWPSVKVSMGGDCPSEQMQQHGQAVPDSHSTSGNRPESSQEGRLWMTPKAGTCGSTAMTSGRPIEKATQLTSQVTVVEKEKQQAWATPSTMDHINVIRKPEERSLAANKGGCKNLREEVHQWATPNTMDYMEPRPVDAMKQMLDHGQRKNRKWSSNVREQVLWDQKYAPSWATPRTGATDNSRPNNKGGIPLGDQARRAEQWATPKASDPQHAGPNMRDSAGNYALPAQVTKAWPTPMGQAQGSTGSIAGSSDFSRKVEQIEGMRETPNGPKTGSGKLNPRWVETLMGLPIGWTMPSCSSPLTIAQTNCDCSEMESCLQQQKELF